ncbi:MAG: hypothetical protein ACOX7D_03670, partial [Alphaproteobacteria bacterium]
VVTPRKAGFWRTEKVLPDEMQESNAEIHTKKAIEIVARAYAAQCIYTNSFSTYFPELLRECTFLRILGNWDEIVRPLSEEEKKYNKKLEEEVARAVENEKEEEEDFDFSREFGYEESSPLAIEFVEIMKTRPDLITEEQKFRAFEIFPLVIEELGRVECQ